jgi:hypothetical protein
MQFVCRVVKIKYKFLVILPQVVHGLQLNFWNRLEGESCGKDRAPGNECITFFHLIYRLTLFRFFW